MMRPIGHPVAATERPFGPQLKPHPGAAQNIPRHGKMRQTREIYWRTRHDNPDLSLDHVGAPRPTTNTVAPDTTTPVGPNTADNALSSYVVILLNTEAPHTHYTSLKK